MSYIRDTIAAIATPSGRGGVGIIRVSGINSLNIAKKIVKKDLKPRIAHFMNFFDKNNSFLDEGIIIYFKAPNSFTGEDIVEFQAHGGPILLNMILKEILFLGARPARAGEFSERAFLNDKLDLLKAEAISDMINAVSEKTVKSATLSLKGDFSKKINEILSKLTYLRMYIEASIDFPEEEVDFLDDDNIKSLFYEVNKCIKDVLLKCHKGAILRDGLNIVIAGKPNAGKSSLLNILTERNSSIITDIPGTTRDTIKEVIQIDGVPINIVDTAGLRITSDVIEKIGVEKALEAIKDSDHILLVKDITEYIGNSYQNNEFSFIKDIKGKIPITHIYNKIDLCNDYKSLEEIKNISLKDSLFISAKHKIGIEELKQHILKSVSLQNTTEDIFTSRTRHIDALNNALNYLNIAKYHLDYKVGELLAEELKNVQTEISKITGAFSSDDLLGKIFSSFCIGK